MQRNVNKSKTPEIMVSLSLTVTVIAIFLRFAHPK